MLVKQISVFLENKSGRLAQVTGILSLNKIDIRALYIADTSEYGILRMIVDKPEPAQKLLEEAGFTVSTTDVLAMAVADSPGTLDKALEVLNKAGISVDYLYAFVGRSKEDAIVVVRVEALDRAVKILQDAGVRVIGTKEVYGL